MCWLQLIHVCVCIVWQCVRNLFTSKAISVSQQHLGLLEHGKKRFVFVKDVGYLSNTTSKASMQHDLVPDNSVSGVLCVHKKRLLATVRQQWSLFLGYPFTLYA